jgi:hypothetical protein
MKVINHPEMARMLIAERQRDLLARAEAQRTVRFARRHRKQLATQPADLAVARIPDFVDGTFREEKTAAPAEAAVPAARQAA